MSAHYVTHFKVERVERTEGARRTHPADDGQRREVTEVGSIVLRAATLDGLARKVAAAFVLFSVDDDQVSPPRTEAVRMPTYPAGAR